MQKWEHQLSFLCSVLRRFCIPFVLSWRWHIMCYSGLKTLYAYDNTVNKSIFLSMSCPQTSLHKGLNYSCSHLSLNSYTYQLELHGLRELKTSILLYLVSFFLITSTSAGFKKTDFPCYLSFTKNKTMILVLEWEPRIALAGKPWRSTLTPADFLATNP